MRLKMKEEAARKFDAKPAYRSLITVMPYQDDKIKVTMVQRIPKAPKFKDPTIYYASSNKGIEYQIEILYTRVPVLRGTAIAPINSDTIDNVLGKLETMFDKARSEVIEQVLDRITPIYLPRDKEIEQAYRDLPILRRIIEGK